MEKSLIKLILILHLIMISIFSEIINLEGNIPYGVDSKILEKEYRRIYKTLSSVQNIDTSELTIEYYKLSDERAGRPTLPEWGGGGAIGNDLIIIPTDLKPFYRKNNSVTISHEITHIVINRIRSNVHIPRFFHEGVAMYLSGDISFGEQSTLSMSLFSQSLMPLISIDTVNRLSRKRAELAYAQSRLTVDYLVKTYDREILSLILDASKRMGDFEKGLIDELDLNIHQLDSLSKIHIAKTYSNLFWLIDSFVVWISILLLFFAAYILTVLRNRKKMKAMEEAERLEEEMQE